MVDVEVIEEASRKKVIFFLWSSISTAHITPSELLYASLNFFVIASLYLSI